MQKYQVIDKIGEGAYGIVLKCKINDPQSIKKKSNYNNKYSDIVAMKQFKDSDENEVVKRTTMREVKVLKMLDHPNIVQLRQAFRKRGFVYLIFQYVRNNLLEVLQKTPDGLDHELIKILMFQLIKGLAYLHNLNIIHRDIKPENLLISEQNQLKICDFGFARIYKKSSKEQLTDYVATRWYRSPELLVGSHYNKEIDMWAAGCIMGQLIDGSPMFPGQNQLDQLFLIQKCLGPLTAQQHQIFLKNPRFVGTKFPQIHNLQTIDKRYAGKFSSKGLNLLKGLVKINPSQRLTASQALRHPYFQGVEEQQNLRKSLATNFVRNDSKITQKEQVNSPQMNTSLNDRKKSNFHSTVYHHESQREKTQHVNNQQDNIFSVFKVQKLNIGKKKKQDNFLNSKGMGNYNTSNITGSTNANNNTSHSITNSNITSMSNGSKSLGRSKVTTKMSTQKQHPPRRISLQKVNNRQIQTKTQTGFYIYGGSIIPQRLDEDQQSAHYIQPQQFNNRIYNVRSPKSRNNVRKQTNLNTQQIIQQDGDGVWQSTGQLPFLMPLPHKDAKHHHHSKGTGHVVPANIIITNSTFNYRHGH